MNNVTQIDLSDFDDTILDEIIDDDDYLDRSNIRPSRFYFKKTSIILIVIQSIKRYMNHCNPLDIRLYAEPSDGEYVLSDMTSDSDSESNDTDCERNETIASNGIDVTNSDAVLARDDNNTPLTSRRSGPTNSNGN